MRPAPSPSPAAAEPAVPLCVDLDGTLIYTDMMWESLRDLLRRNPLSILAMLGWLGRGRAYLKQEIARRARVDVAALPLQGALLAFLRQEKARGRRLVLATASDVILANQVAAHVGLFDEVLASDGARNVRGRAKAAALDARFGVKNWDYAGNSRVDLPVWAAARQALVVNASPRLLARARAVATVTAVFPVEPGQRLRAPW